MKKQTTFFLIFISLINALTAMQQQCASPARFGVIACGIINQLPKNKNLSKKIDTLIILEKKLTEISLEKTQIDHAQDWKEALETIGENLLAPKNELLNKLESLKKKQKNLALQIEHTQNDIFIYSLLTLLYSPFYYFPEIQLRHITGPVILLHSLVVSFYLRKNFQLAKKFNIFNEKFNNLKKYDEKLCKVFELINKKILSLEPICNKNC